MKFTNRNMTNKMMMSMIAIAVSAFASAQVSLAAPEPMGDKECRGEHCYRTREVCFNVYCTYRKEKKDDVLGDLGGHSSRCVVAASFTHLVTEDGRETWGNSEGAGNPKFSVSCDDHILYDGSGHRYTDRLGTRIQGIPGPYPAIVLPQGALRELRHYSESSLEFADERWDGSCYIYPGPAIM